MNIARPANVTITPRVFAEVLSLPEDLKFIPEIIAATENAEIANATGANAIIKETVVNI